MSEETIARYSFVPWLRQGLASDIPDADTLTDGGLAQERVEIDVTLTVNDGPTVSKKVELIGPGDITSIDPRAVVRTEPKHWTTDFEPNYLPFIEFYDEDFLWRYTPAASTPQHRLRPWLCLIVLEEGEFERASMTGTLPVIEITGALGSIMPPLDQVWAWAHVHVNRDVSASDGSASQAIANLEAALSANSDVAISRLMSPRRLKANTPYYAFVIPTFETGRLAGLGQDVPAGSDGLASSWGSGQTTFPVYYEWYFRTGMRGDFEYLVRLLEPRVLDPRIGIRDMDVQDPGYGVPSATAEGVLGLEGALKTPSTTSTPWPDNATFQNDLAALVNLPQDLIDAGDTASPTVAPPLYGQWHANVRRLRATGVPPWVNQLNLDPRHRASAGLGTLVVQTNQEALMNEAWRQVGEIEEANRRQRRGQFSREGSLRLFGKSFQRFSAGQLLSATALVQSRVVLNNGNTVRLAVRESTLTRAAVSPAFRRIARPRGPVMRQLAPDRPRRPGQLIERINSGEITAAPPKTVPPGLVAVDTVAEGVPVSEAPGCLKPVWSVARVVIAILVMVLRLLSRVFASLGDFADKLQGWLSDVDAGEGLSEAGRTREAIRRIPGRPGFSITQPGASTTPVGSGQDSPQAARFRQALLGLHERFEIRPVVRAPQPLNLAAMQTQLLAGIEPETTVAARVRATARIPEVYLAGLDDPLDTVMAYPDFPRPMYEPLRDLSSELLIPNLNLIPMNTLGLLKTNQPFIEAYMVGLNHEMARELLWREYPTDRRGSYFRQFWDVSDMVPTDSTLTPAQLAESLRDIAPIHTWPRSANLGENNNRQFGDSDENLVLVIRGDLLKKYPTAVIYAASAEWADDPSATRRRMPNRDQVKFPVFKAKVDPDLTFLGFELTDEQARGSANEGDANPGWFFVIEERPGEPRFGMDDPVNGFSSVGTARSWNDLSWAHLAADEGEFTGLTMIDLSRPLNRVSITSSTPDAGVSWARDSADMAYILLQVPVRIYVHASEMLP